MTPQPTRSLSRDIGNFSIERRDNVIARDFELRLSRLCVR